jgi:hypothetical protein
VTPPATPSGPRTCPGWFAAPWLAAACVAFVGLTVWQYDRYPIDGDELFSLTTARQDWPGLIEKTARDFSHPPLSYALLKLWIAAGGEGFAWIKLLPTAFGLLALVPVLFAARELGLRPAEAAVAVLLIGACTFLLQLMHWVRMYAELHFFAAWGVYFLAGAVNRERLSAGWWAGWFVTSLLMVYSHYWGFVALAAEGVVLLLFAPRHVPRFVLVGVGVTACFAPWAWVFLSTRRQVGTATAQVEWIPKPSVMDVVYFWDFLNGRLDFPHSTKAGTALFGGVLAAYLISRWRSPADRRLAGVCAPLIVVPVVLTFVASRVQEQSVFQARTLVSVAVPYFVLVAAAACRLPGRWLRASAVVAVVAWVLAAVVPHKFGPDEKPQWDEMIARVKREEPGDGPVRVQLAGPHFLELATFYDARTGGRPLEPHVGLVPDDNPARFWVLDTRTGDAAIEPAAAIRERIVGRGYTVGEGFAYSVARYHFEFYPVWRPGP